MGPDDDLWQALGSAQAAPETANCVELCTLLTQHLAGRSDAEQLELGAEAILQIAEVCWQQAQTFSSQWSTDAANEAGNFAGIESPEPVGFPTLSAEELRQWERQFMAVDLDADEEHWSHPSHRSTTRRATDSIAGPVKPKQVLKLIQDLAGNDTPTLWAQAIRQWFAESAQAKGDSPTIAFSVLCEQMELPWVEIWMGLLLGGFELRQSGDFYEAEVWVCIPAPD